MSTTHRGSCSCDCDTEASSLRRFLAGSNTRQIVEFTPLRPMHCYLVRKADAGSVPCSTTNTQRSTVRCWPFFLPDRADSRVFAGVRAEACGLRRPASGPVQGHLPLSPGHFSLRPRSPLRRRSPQRPSAASMNINKLHADRSSGWMAASPTRRYRGAVPFAWNFFLWSRSFCVFLWEIRRPV